MVSKESLREQFEELGCEPSNAILNKSIEICSIYNINDPEEFVESWMAFSVSKLNGKEPTIEYLNDFERTEYANANKKNKAKEVAKNIRKMPDSNENFKIYKNDDHEKKDIDTDIMDSYICHTPKTNKGLPRIETPKSLFNPVSYSPISTATSTKNINEILPFGSVVYTFGNPDLLKNISWSSTTINNKDILEILEVPLNDKEKILKNERAMVDKQYTKCNISEIKLYDIGKRICGKFLNANNILSDSLLELTEYDDLTNVDVASQYMVKCIGRICGDCDGQLNSGSVLLIGNDDFKLRSVNLNLSKAKFYTIFPGQIVLANGMNPRGDQLFVEEIHSEYDLPTIIFPDNITTPISLVIAAGPFTQQDNLKYEPLQSLLNYCKENQPDVVILIGPFLDEDNNLMTEMVMAEEYGDYFEKMINGIIETVGSTVQILCVSSTKDMHSTTIYPTLPFKINENYSNLKFLPDPCIIKINNFTIGITATDVLQHLLDDELILNAGHDKIKRALNYLFYQQSFYPINPPHDDIFLDSNLASLFANLNIVPNMMIVPGNLKYFIRDINNCLAINPGKVVNSNDGGGTFARMIINPVKDGNKLLDFIASQVLRI